MQSQDEYSGRPPKRLSLLIIYGHEASMAYEDEERDEVVLSNLGKLVRHKFKTLQERNAFIQGVDEATGYLHSIVIEE